MPNFDITRDEGLASVNGMLRSLASYTILAAWKDESGAWLCAGNVPGSPNIYAVHWRSADHYGCGTLQFKGAFECADPDIAWVQLMQLSQAAWERGPSGEIKAKAAGIAERIKEGNTRGGQRSGETRSKNAEEIAEAKELARKFRILFVPKYDPKTWFFNPGRDTRGNPVINFTWKKQQQTYAYIGLSRTSNNAWEIGRGWFPGMNDDNARIEEVCFPEIGNSYEPDDVAFQTFVRLLKTDPEKWLRKDYIRFAPEA